MQKIIFILMLCSVLANNIKAQGYVYSVKGGLSMGIQKWDVSKKSPLFKYHGAISVENLDDKSALLAQIGYHIRGSADRFNAYVGPLADGSVGNFPRRTIEYQFRNLVLMLGAKRKFDWGKQKGYYVMGLRGEYTINTNLNSLSENPGLSFYSVYFPIDENVRKFNFGVTAGGGVEWMFSDLIGGFLELNVSPDFSRQYYRTQITIYDPFTRQNRVVPEQRIKNVSVELSAGIRLLRKIEYIDTRIF